MNDDELRTLAASAGPSVRVRPGLAADVLRDARTTRRRGRRWTVAGAGALVVAGLAAGAVPGAGPYVRHYQPSGSMEPTVPIAAHVVAKRGLAPARGDLVVVHHTYEEGVSEDALKRVLGLPGDVVACPDSGDGTCPAILVNGEPETDGLAGGPAFETAVVPAGQLFLVGDARENSLDSRQGQVYRTSDLVGTVVRIEDATGSHAVPGAPVHPGPDGQIDPPGDIPPAAARAVP